MFTFVISRNVYTYLLRAFIDVLLAGSARNVWRCVITDQSHPCLWTMNFKSSPRRFRTSRARWWDNIVFLDDVLPDILRTNERTNSCLSIGQLRPVVYWYDPRLGREGSRFNSQQNPRESLFAIFIFIHFYRSLNKNKKHIALIWTTYTSLIRNSILGLNISTEYNLRYILDNISGWRVLGEKGVGYKELFCPVGL